MAKPVLLSIVEMGGYPDFRPLYQRAGFDVVVEHRMRKAMSVIKKVRPRVIVAEFNFQSDFRDRTSSLESMLSVVERLPADSPSSEDVLVPGLGPLIDITWERGDLDLAEARVRELLAVVDPETTGAPTSRLHVLYRAHAHLRRQVREAWIVEAVRTPIGRHRGALRSVRPDDLAALVAQHFEPDIRRFGYRFDPPHGG